MDSLSDAQADAYLARIGLDPGVRHDLDALHLAHLRTVPFENLDIHLGRPIRIDLCSVYHKVVGARRGGYCYELNSLFAALLAHLGHPVDLLSARVARDDGTFGPEFDHLAMRVISGGEPYLADVGFGDAFLVPLPLRDATTRTEPGKTLRLTYGAGRWTYLEDRGQGFDAQYAFTPRARRVSDFAAMNHWQQTSPDSHFTQNRIISIASPDGRASISGQRLIVTTRGERHTADLADEQYRAELAERFGVRLDAVSPPA